MGIRTALLLGFVFFASVCVSAAEPESPEKPLDIAALKKEYLRPDSIPHSDKNEFTQARWELGYKLFHDPRLSRSKQQSCATCHNPSFYWTDTLKNSTETSRKVPHLENLAWDSAFNWDGRFDRLMSQHMFAAAATTGMNMSASEVADVVSTIPGYAPLIEAAYPKHYPKVTAIFASLEVYVRSIVSGEAPFDRWIAGDESAISNQAKQGFALFNGKAKCATCHNSWRFSDGKFHDIGLKGNDLGQGGYARNEEDFQKTKFHFKTSGLRNVAMRPPYMHTGEFNTLREVVDFYDRGGDIEARPTLAKEMIKLNLSEDDKQALEAFLKTLSSPLSVTYPVLPR